MKYELSHEQLQTIVNYLATKPFAEVFQLMNMLQTLPKTEIKTEKE